LSSGLRRRVVLREDTNFRIT